MGIPYGPNLEEKEDLNENHVDSFQVGIRMRAI